MAVKDPRDPQIHQRDVGEREHFNAPQEGTTPDDDALKAQAQEKANKNNTHRDEQTGRAMAAAAAEAQRHAGDKDQDAQPRKPGGYIPSMPDSHNEPDPTTHGDSNRLTGNRQGGQRNG